MIPGWIILILAAVSWVSVAILARAAAERPYIGALTERTIIAVILALFTTLYGLLATDVDSGFIGVSDDIAQVIRRILVIAIGIIPVYWVGLYLTGRLGDRSK